MNDRFQRVTDAESQLYSDGFLALEGPSSPNHSPSSHSSSSVPSASSSIPPPSTIPAPSTIPPQSPIPPPSPIPLPSSHAMLAIIGQLEEKLANDRNRIGQLEEKLANDRNRIGQLEENSANDRNRIGQLEENSASDKNRIGQLEEEMASHRIENQKLLARLAILEDEKELANSVLSLSKAEKTGREEGEDKLEALATTLSKNVAASNIARRVKSRTDRKHKMLFSPYVNKKAVKCFIDPSKPKPKPKPKGKGKKNAAEAIAVDNYEIKAIPALLVDHFVGRSQVDPETISVLKGYFEKYPNQGDDVFIFGDSTFGDSTIFRSSVDEILKEEELSDLHVDAFAAILFHRLSLQYSASFVPSIYVSPALHIWRTRNLLQEDDPPNWIAHINKESVAAAQYMFVPVVCSGHWILGVGLLKERKWQFYDSLPKVHHLDNLKKAIENVHEYCSAAFGEDEDICSWPILHMTHAPKQDNSLDCGIFVCRYIETLVCNNGVDWECEGDWNLDNHKFRIQLALDFFEHNTEKVGVPVGIL